MSACERLQCSGLKYGAATELLSYYDGLSDACRAFVAGGDKGDCDMSQLETAQSLLDAFEIVRGFKEAPFSVTQFLKGALIDPFVNDGRGRCEGRDASSGAAATSSADDLAAAASRAADSVGTGRGAAYGTRVHAAFADEIASLGRSDVFSEVSYLNGRVVRYGTPGSVRLDAVVGNPAAPTAIYDLKTGTAALTSSRIAAIRAELPPGFQDIPVLELRP